MNLENHLHLAALWDQQDRKSLTRHVNHWALQGQKDLQVHPETAVHPGPVERAVNLADRDLQDPTARAAHAVLLDLLDPQEKRDLKGQQGQVVLLDPQVQVGLQARTDLKVALEMVDP